MKGRLVPRSALTVFEEHAMHALCARHFEGVDHDAFRADLDDKNWVLLLEESGELAGFSTLHYHGTRHRGRPIRVVYSGDTIVDPTAWSRSVLAAAWIGAVRRLHRSHEDEPLWWLLLVSGFRTYRFLPLFWREFHPCFDVPFSDERRALRDTLARRSFGEAFDPEAGVARLDHPMVLRPALRRIPATRLSDPHVAFFRECNPGHVRGDELVCLTRIAASNLTPAGRRMWDAGERALEPGPAARERAS